MFNFNMQHVCMLSSAWILEVAQYQLICKLLKVLSNPSTNEFSVHSSNWFVRYFTSKSQYHNYYTLFSSFNLYLYGLKLNFFQNTRDLKDGKYLHTDFLSKLFINQEGTHLV